MHTPTSLPTILRANALYCITAGGAFILFSPTLTGWFGLTMPGIINLLGGVMVLYGGILIWGAGSRLHFWARIATALDFLWILGTLLLLFTDWLPLTTAGNWLLALAGLGVLVFAILQLRELRTVIA